MPNVLVIADEPWIRNEVHASLTADGVELIDHTDPSTVVAALEEHDIDVVIADMQVASMGGMAIVREVRSATSLDGMDPIPVILLLDRSADAFLAKRAAAAAWVQKPFSSRDLSDALAQVFDDDEPVDDMRAIPAAELGTAVLPDDSEPESAA